MNEIQKMWSLKDLKERGWPDALVKQQRHQKSRKARKAYAKRSISKKDG